MNKIGLCVVLLSIAVLMGTCFFAINEEWTAAQAFYWTIITMTVSYHRHSSFTLHRRLPYKIRYYMINLTANCDCQTLSDCRVW